MACDSGHQKSTGDAAQRGGGCGGGEKKSLRESFGSAEESKLSRTDDDVCFFDNGASRLRMPAHCTGHTAHSPVFLLVNYTQSEYSVMHTTVHKVSAEQ